MKNKIPTAEKYFKLNCKDKQGGYKSASDIAIEFANLHVQEALKQIKENITVDCHCVEGYCNGVDKSSILNSYSTENIK